MSLFDIFKTKPKVETKSNEEQFKDTFILALVHRLRTPLNGIRWAMDAVIKKESDAEIKETLTGGYTKVIDSINTVNEILKVAEINSDDIEMALKKEKLDFCTIVDEILKNLDFLKNKKEINLVYDKKCNPLTIYGDKEILILGLTNFFDNAFRYSPRGTVTVTLSKEGSMAKLVIKDTGIGISKEDLGHMFEKFYRGSNAKILDPNVVGGIGLYATKKIIELHGGNVSLDSELNTGTTIEVRLPID